MADFDNIPIDVSAEDLENVAKRPYKVVARPPTGLDTGETGQWWIEIDSETEEVVQIYQRVGFKWVSYLNDETKIAGLKIKDNISVEDLLTALDVYPLIFGSDPPTSSTKGYAKQIYFDIENATFYVCRGLVGSGYLWEKAFTSSGTGGNIDLSDYVKKSRKIAGIDLEDDITVEELQTALCFDEKADFIVITPPHGGAGITEMLANVYDKNCIGVIKQGGGTPDWFFWNIFSYSKNNEGVVRRNINKQVAVALYEGNADMRFRTSTRNSDGELVWSDWEYFRLATKDDINGKADKSYVDNIVDSINSALDELHAYAQGLITGGDEV